MHPLIEGRCVTHHTFTAKSWLSGRGRSAVWQNMPSISAKSNNDDWTVWNPQFWIKPQNAIEHLGKDYFHTNWRLGVWFFAIFGEATTHALEIAG